MRRQRVAVVVVVKRQRQAAAAKEQLDRPRLRVDHEVQSRCKSISTESNNASLPSPECQSGNTRICKPGLTAVCSSSNRVARLALVLAAVAVMVRTN